MRVDGFSLGCFNSSFCAFTFSIGLSDFSFASFNSSRASSNSSRDGVEFSFASSEFSRGSSEFSFALFKSSRDSSNSSQGGVDFSFVAFKFSRASSDFSFALFNSSPDSSNLSLDVFGFCIGEEKSSTDVDVLSYAVSRFSWEVVYPSAWWNGLIGRMKRSLWASTFLPERVTISTRRSTSTNCPLECLLFG